MKRILVPVDFSSQSEVALARARAIALESFAELLLVHCAPPPELSIVAIEPIYATPAVLEKFSRDRSVVIDQKLKELASTIHEVKVRTVVRPTMPADGICSTAEKEKCDLIVMGSHGAGLDRFLLGSVAERVTRNAPCPVMVVRDEDASPIRKAVIGIDFSPYSRPLVALAQSMLPEDAQIELVHVWQPPHLDTAHLFGNPGHPDLFEVMNQGLAEHLGTLQEFAESLPGDRRFSIHVATDRPPTALLERAKEMGARAIFVGAHGADRIENLLGTVSDRVLRHAPNTVLLTERALEQARAQLT